MRVRMRLSMRTRSRIVINMKVSMKMKMRMWMRSRLRIRMMTRIKDQDQNQDQDLTQDQAPDEDEEDDQDHGHPRDCQWRGNIEYAQHIPKRSQKKRPWMPHPSSLVTRSPQVAIFQPSLRCRSSRIASQWHVLRIRACMTRRPNSPIHDISA